MHFRTCHSPYSILWSVVGLVSLSGLCPWLYLSKADHEATRRSEPRAAHRPSERRAWRGQCQWAPLRIGSRSLHETEFVSNTKKLQLYTNTAVRPAHMVK